jgi:carboxyl-terminal processing protease
MQPTLFMRTAQSIALSMGVLALSSCGGGGGDGGASALPASSTLVNQCEAPRPGTADTPGSIDKEKAWVRAFMDETYLWYKDVPQVDAAAFTKAKYKNSTYETLAAYFQALKTPLRTATGDLVDKFSYTQPTEQANLQQSGITSGFGIHWTANFRSIDDRPPRVLRVIYTEPGSPAEGAGLMRGDTIKTVDGYSIDDETFTGKTAVIDGLFPKVAVKTTVMDVQAPNGTATRRITATSSANVAIVPVSITKSVVDGTSTVGYVALHTFNVYDGERQLINAVNQLKADRVNELVLDLRYNGGGLLYLSGELGWMIGDSQLSGKTFDKIICNDKNPLDGCGVSIPFSSQAIGFSAPKGQTLPQLGLKRVFVLTSRGTCSASEALINGLSPFVQVIRIGDTTCGKPYVFIPTDNCGTTYNAVNFKGVNALGFGDFVNGFAPTCPVADDLSKPLGDTTERMFSAALTYARGGTCPAASSAMKRDSIAQASPSTALRQLRDLSQESAILQAPRKAVP